MPESRIFTLFEARFERFERFFLDNDAQILL